MVSPPGTYVHTTSHLQTSPTAMKCKIIAPRKIRSRKTLIWGKIETTKARALLLKYIEVTICIRNFKSNPTIPSNLIAPYYSQLYDMAPRDFIELSPLFNFKSEEIQLSPYLNFKSGGNTWSARQVAMYTPLHTIKLGTPPLNAKSLRLTKSWVVKPSFAEKSKPKELGLCFLSIPKSLFASTISRAIQRYLQT